MEVKVVFEDGTEVIWAVGELYNFEKLSMKDGTDPAAWEAEENDDAEDIAKMQALIDKGETTDGWYPGN